ncbi:Na/Pi cotransporter family protein [Methylotetracoccus oryzae]|uniref:Na/Pi cotransporter family protein n=1 Tax=Methylotetracoccus oryzae TaxID=1919059 RepID=UPI0013A5669E|nr:Na/Pi symporter [Methylotetracoccus oryzae]
MTELQALFAALSAIVLFLYGLQGFSRELRVTGGTALQNWLASVTASRWLGFTVGAVATAIVQSSSAVTALTAALVDGAVISFRASLGVLLGSNVGTTATAWLVSMKLTGVGPAFIVLGACLSALPWRVGIAGKAIFYFGLIFFALDLIGTELRPLREQPAFVAWLELAQAPWLGILVGMVFTALIQSSSVTTGVSILLVQQGTLPAEAAIPIVIGANVGSTSTALVASLGMGAVARATATANLLFNAAGALIFFPFIHAFAGAVVDSAGDPSRAVAWAHLLFNVTIGLVFLVALDAIEPRLSRWFLGPMAARSAARH